MAVTLKLIKVTPEESKRIEKQMRYQARKRAKQDAKKLEVRG